MSKKIPVGILGATGVVGQRFIQMLEAHPWFEVAWLAASERSAGSAYEQAASWRLNTPIPPAIAEMRIANAVPEKAPRVIFSALDARVASELEPAFAAAGCAVVSNSSAFRMNDDVPLIIPEVNPDHVKLVENQKCRRKSGGFILTNPNCSTIGLVMALAPLARKFGIEQVSVVTMQAVSGAGYPGVASLDILGNVIPYISSEEEKLEAETLKLLGTVRAEPSPDQNSTDGPAVTLRIEPATFAVSAQCNRVAVEDGHTESVSVKFKTKPTAELMITTWKDFSGVPQELRLPTAPAHPLFYDQAKDRPQPRLDVGRGAGMTASIGRLRACNVLDWKFTVLSHNTVRGAAGAAILNAELLKAQGYLN